MMIVRPMMVAVAMAAGIAPAWAADPPRPIEVPYRLTPTQHVLIRVKLNGQGPFNFILDTGAPALFVTTKVAEKAGVKRDARGWGQFDQLEIEGGVVIRPARGRVEDLFQLEGMNGIGLAGAELHGVIGYELLARYRIEFDFTRDKLSWTKLNFQPPRLSRMEGRGAPAGLNALGAIMKFFGGMMGLKANSATEPRGFFGAELAERGGRLVVTRIVPNGPAAKGGLRTGDIVDKWKDAETPNLESFRETLGKLRGSDKFSVTVQRDGESVPLTIELGKGL